MAYVAQYVPDNPTHDSRQPTSLYSIKTHSANTPRLLLVSPSLPFYTACPDQECGSC